MRLSRPLRSRQPCGAITLLTNLTNLTTKLTSPTQPPMALGSYLRDTRISTRLVVGIGVAVLLLVLMVWVGASRLGAVKARLDWMTSVQQPKISAAKRLSELMRTMDVSLRDIVLLNDGAAMLKEVDRLKALREEYQTSEQALQAAIEGDDPSVRDALNKAHEAVQAMNKPVDKAIRLGAANKPEEATRVLLEEIRPLGDQALTAIEALTRTEIEAGETARQEAEHTYRQALVWLGTIGALATVLLIVFGWGLVRSITRPLNTAVSVARAIARGDLSQAIDVDDPAASGEQRQLHNETDLLLAALKEMQGALVSVVQGVRDRAENVAVGSSEISQGNNDLADRTERQACTLAEAASSMRQLGTTVARNLDNARKADSLVVDVSNVAQRGTETVRRVVETMEQITANSRLIADIIGVVDGITFQTNILALNAGVEAARAGDQGRGFAVVAGEVRTLAQRSASASKEISALINASVQSVEQGTEQVDSARQTMVEMMSSVSALRTLMSEIRELSTAQSTDVSQVVQAVLQMDNATQQNSALVEQSAVAAENLKTQAAQLVEAVAVFHIGEDNAGTSKAPDSA